ncbi:hypothetical protein [Microtetraspora sp. NBRC 16547]|uniref:hypothetical protein n=1 Tax=Microtetraspora sp. NBRC 16547 TaxID=3030993 RepID=UPI002553AC5E|nr:hypothetical protein [Microtetraspora sp. NBRC 16547]
MPATTAPANAATAASPGRNYHGAPEQPPTAAQRSDLAYGESDIREVLMKEPSAVIETLSRNVLDHTEDSAA